MWAPDTENKKKEKKTMKKRRRIAGTRRRTKEGHKGINENRRKEWEKKKLNRITRSKRQTMKKEKEK